ncbi:FKBP-type peptidyl-prolyl cis-trans isomerase [Candidatus Nitrospira bockiana]
MRQGLLAVCVALAGTAVPNAHAGSPVADGAKVTLEYTLSVPDKGASSGEKIMTYTHGQHEILPGLEQALSGMHEGEQKRVELGPEQAYGRYDPSKRQSVDRQQLPAEIQPGAVLKSREKESFATVLELNEHSAVLDLNHPLAGQRVVYDVRILSVEPKAAGP